MIVGGLGRVVFLVSSKYIKTINDLEINKSVNYAEHRIIKGKPKLEFLNNNLDTLTFKIRLNIFYNVNPLAAAKELENYMNNGEILRFILGAKKVGSGKYVITELKESHRKFTAIGTVSEIELEVNLKEYN